MEKIMKEAIRMVPESIYDPDFTDIADFRSGRGCHSALRRIKEEWGTSRWFLEFDIRKSFHTLDQHRLIPILKEEIDDPKFFDFIQKVFSAGRLVEGSTCLLKFVRARQFPDSVPHSVLLSAILGNIYLHKLDQEIVRIRQKYDIPIVQRMRSILLKTSRIDDQEKSVREEESFSAPQEKRTSIVERGKSSQRKAVFQSRLSSWQNPPESTPRFRGDQKRPFVLSPSSSALAAVLNKSSSLLLAPFLIQAHGLTTPKDELDARECLNQNWAMRDLFPYSKRKGMLLELGEAGRDLFRAEKARKPDPLKSQELIKIYYARYADDLLVGIVGAVELLIEIQKRIAHFLQYGLNLGMGTLGSTRIASRSKVEFLGNVIREGPTKKTPIQFLREQEKRRRVKDRIHITASQLRSDIQSKFRKLEKSITSKKLTNCMRKTVSIMDVLQLEETLRTATDRSPQVNLCENVKHIQKEIYGVYTKEKSNGKMNPQDRSRISTKKFEFYNITLQNDTGERATHADRYSNRKGPIQIQAPIKKILKRLRERGIISRRRPWPIHVKYLTNRTDQEIVNWFARIAISTMFYYKYRDNLQQIKNIVDYQIRWAAIFTLAHKHKTAARNIIKKYSKDLNIANQKDQKTIAKFPNRKEINKISNKQQKNKKQ